MKNFDVASSNNISSDRDDNESSVIAQQSLLFSELGQVKACIQSIIDSCSTLEVKSKSLDNFRQLLDKYLECPTLLDRHMEDLVHPLALAARDNLLQRQQTYYSINNGIKIENDSLPYILSSIYALSKVRGRKRIQKLLPHQVGDVEPVLFALRHLENATTSNVATTIPITTTTTPTAMPQTWESQYTLWNWMGILSMVPFDCSVLNDEISTTLIPLAKSHLCHTGLTREVAAVCLASWLSRPDLEKTELPQFVTWCCDLLKSKSNVDIFLLMGVMQTLVAILKNSTTSREALIEQIVEPLWEIQWRLSGSNPSNVLLRKLLVKWWTRASCVYLPPRVASWRYHRGRRSLKDNVQNMNDNINDNTSIEDGISQKKNDFENCELFLVPDQVEDAMGQVLDSLTDSATVVRWSAAKGVGRITERLPAICSEDVLNAILELFLDFEMDHAWHGACLALAELARRGLLLPHRLKHVMPWIIQAIQYDIQKGHSSVGAHVRDAACYTYWAFARAYAPSIMRPFVTELSHSIVVASLFDREVNCRRAASAAFQEFVGRQGADNFKNGISILTAADYFTLGNRTDSYTTVAYYVAQFKEYRRPIISHLYEVKLSHWDLTIRSLASKSLHELTKLDPTFVVANVIPYLLKNSLDPKNVHLRHGSVIGLAEIILAIGMIKKNKDAKNDENCFNFSGLLSQQETATIAELVPTIEKKRLYRGKGGEQMRDGVCRLIECIATAHIPLTVKQQVSLLDSIDACIPHPSETIQKQACVALRALMLQYFPVGPNGPTDRLQKRVVDKYVKQLRTNDNPAATRGFALALGYLPAKLLAPSTKVLDTVLAPLCRASRPDAKIGNEKDAETRRNALIALMHICQTVGIGDSPSTSENNVVTINKKQVSHVLGAFLNALGDYNTDRRGDVGSWCRIAAMDGLVAITPLLCTPSNRDLFSDNRCKLIIGGLLKQFAEKLDVVRSHAGSCLKTLLLCSDPVIPYVPQHAILMEALHISANNAEIKEEVNWADSSVTFSMVMKAARIDELFEDIVAGLIVSVGCLTESVSNHATSALVQWVKTSKGTPNIMRLGDVLLKLFESHSRQGRVILPLLKTINMLLSKVCIDELVTDVKFSNTLVSYLEKESTNCNDVHRLFAITNVALGLVGGLHPNKDALIFVCSQLSHPFPRVRRFTAENFYVTLLETPNLTSYDGENGEHPALEILLNTRWDAEMSTQDSVAMTNKVSASLGIDGAQESKTMKV